MSDNPESDDPGYDPMTGIPKLPAAFRGRRRFSLRPTEPEPEEPDEHAEFLARARAWAEEEAVGVEPEPEAVPAREAVNAFLGRPDRDDDRPVREAEPVVVTPPAPVEEEPVYVIGIDDSPSPGRILDGDDVALEEEEPAPANRGLPRLPVAGAPVVTASPELPAPPKGKDWPTETPPATRMRTDYARGAANSLGASGEAPVQFGEFIQPRSGRDLGHTLAPRNDLELEPAEPPPADPRPSLERAGRFPVRSRPLSRSQTGSPPPTQMPVPSPLHRPAEPEAPPVAEVEVEATRLGALAGFELDASSSVHLAPADLIESFEGRAPFEHPAPSPDEETHVFSANELPLDDEALSEPGPVDFDYDDVGAPSLEGIDPDREAPEERTNAATLAAVGCLVAFAVFGTLGTIALLAVVSMG